MPSESRPPTLDPVAVARWKRTATHQSPWLHEEVARRMLDRLTWVKLQPRTWAHWDALRGGTAVHEALRTRYRTAGCFVVEDQAARQTSAIRAMRDRWWSPRSWGGSALRVETPPNGSCDMLWANMSLHEAADPSALMACWHQALAVNGFLMFSCLGPDTARELRYVYSQMGWPAAGHQLTDMHDWGDMLVHAGFAEPVMDMERITLTYESPARLLQELRELGRNFHPLRFPSMRGRGWRTDVEKALAQYAPRDEAGRWTLTFEIIYGHALKAPPKVAVSALSSVSIADMRSMLSKPRRSHNPT